MTIKKLSASVMILAFSLCQIPLGAFAFSYPDGEVEHMQATKHSKIDLVKINLHMYIQLKITLVLLQ